MTLVKFLRVREKRLLPLLALFTAQALAFSRDWRDPLQDVFQLASGAAGLALVVLLSRRAVPKT